jgi:hypothetical protein
VDSNGKWGEDKDLTFRIFEISCIETSTNTKSTLVISHHDLIESILASSNTVEVIKKMLSKRTCALKSLEMDHVMISDDTGATLIAGGIDVNQ